MRIERYNIPKLPRSKYSNSGNIYIGSGGTGNGGTVINNYSSKLYDGLDSASITEGLTANQGKVLNEIKLSKTTDDTAEGKITLNKGSLTKDSILADSKDQIGLIKVSNDWWVSANLINGINKIQGYNGQIMNNLSVGNDTRIGGISIFKEGFKTQDFNNTEEIGSSLYKDESNKWNFVVDNAKVRGRLDVQTLQIEQARAIGGKIYCTLGGFKISKIGEDSNIYRCYFKTKDDDGNVIYNQLREGDLAFCQTFNNNKVKRYWRYVTGVGEDFVDLSKTNCEAGSSAPEVGDEVVQLGNTKDPSRQGAVLIETLAINIYNNIDTFKLPGAIITLNPVNSKIDASTIEFLGKTLINDNFIVDEKGNLTIKGNINTHSGNIGNFIINERGLYNDDGFAEIEFANNDYGFSIGTEHNIGLVDAWTRTDDVLNVSTEFGTAVKAYSNSGWGLVASKTRVEGLHLATNEIPYNVYHVTLSLYDDFLTFNSTKPINVDLPEITKDTKGKIYHFKNLGTGTVTIWGDIVRATSEIAGQNLTINTPKPFTLICDEKQWYEI